MSNDKPMSMSPNRVSWPASPSSAAPRAKSTKGVAKGNCELTVCARLRPPLELPRQESGRFKPGARIRRRSQGSSTVQEKCIHWSDQHPKRVTLAGSEESGFDIADFDFDKVFNDQCSQLDVYQYAAKPLIPAFLEGENVCCIAYGQSKSGKTHTLIGEVSTSSRFHGGSDLDSDASCVSSLSSCGVSEAHGKPQTPQTTENLKRGVPTHFGKTTKKTSSSHQGRWKSLSGRRRDKIDLPGLDEEEDFPAFVVDKTGIIPRLVHDISSQAELTISGKVAFKLYCSYVEIHNDRAVDLLAGSTSTPKSTIKVRRGPDGRFRMEGATEELIPNPSVIVELLQRDNERRTGTASADLNSALHHTIFVLKAETTNYATHETTSNFFCIVDLAKSDIMALASEVDDILGFPRNDETKFVFRTLTTLGAVLSNVKSAKKMDNISQMVELALDRVSRVCLILNVSQSVIDAEHTYKTLRFGQRVMLREADGISKDVQHNSDREDVNGILARQDERPLDLMEKMKEMEQELQHFRIGADERSKLDELARTKSSKSFMTAAGGNRSGKADVQDESFRIKKIDADKTKAVEAGVGTGGSPSKSPKQVENEVAAAREELNRVSALLRSAANRMGADLNVTREELDRARNYPEQADVVNHESVLPDSMKPSQQKPFGMQREYEELQHKLRKRERMLKEKDVTIIELKKNNLALQKSKKKRDHLLAKAKSEMKLLLIRVLEAEAHLKEVKSDQLSRIEDACNSTEVDLVHPLSYIDGSRATGSVGTPATEFVTTADEGTNYTSIGSVDESYLSQKQAQEPIRVCLRLRPLSKLETSRRSRCCIDVQAGSTEFTVDSPLDGEYDFQYDQVFDVNANQEEIYDFVRTAGVKDVLQGINCCVVAYGLSGSGKSYTMVGELSDSTERIDAKSDEKSWLAPASCETSLGIIPRMARDLFEEIDNADEQVEFTVRCSFIGMYLEKMFDLLEPHVEKHVFVKEDNFGVHFDGASEAWCFRESDMMAVIRRGTAVLSLLSQRLDISVQRMHSFFTVAVEQVNRVTGAKRASNLYLANLSGAKSKVTSKLDVIQEETEPKTVNGSVFAFNNMIKSLADGKTEVLYTESKLTSFLKDAFGGNCRTTVIITASPSSYSISETMNAIRLGQRCRKVMNTPRINEFSSARRARNGKVAPEHGEEWNNRETRRSVTEVESIRKKAGQLGETCTQAQLREAISAKEQAESQLADLQSEVILLRRQNNSLVNDNKSKEAEISTLKKELKLVGLKKSAVEYKLDNSQFRERDALTFMRHLRRICWKLQKDITTDRVTDVSEITSCISGAPDLSGLVELDTLLLNVGLIDHREIKDGDDEDSLDELRMGRTSACSTVGNGSYVDFPQKDDDETGATTNILVAAESSAVGPRPLNKRGGLRLRPAHLLSSVASALPFHGYSHHGPSGGRQIGLTKSVGEGSSRGTSPSDRVQSTQREHQLEKDLRIMTQKCIELQVLLNEEKATVDMLVNKSGNLNHKKLAQEVISLKKERDVMMHNAKAATWKLQELHVVNRIMYKKALESQQHVASLEEGFQRLQETFRATALESLAGEAKFREEISLLHSIIDDLTSPEDQRIDGEEIDLPECRVNLTLRGGGKRLQNKKKAALFVSSDAVGSSQQRSVYLPVLSKCVIRRRVVASKRPEHKFRRRLRKMGDSIGGAHKAKMLAIQKQNSRPVLFEGRELFFSVLRGM